MRCHALLAFALLTLAVPTSPAQAQLDEDITFRIGTLFPDGHFETDAYRRMAELMAEKSGGKIELQVFPSSQLGTEREQTEQVDLGALECHSSGGAIQNYAPGLGAWSLPFLFRGPEHYAAVMDGPIGEEFKDMLLKNSNIRILALYPTGTRMFFTNGEPPTTLEDFRGIKIRVDDQPISAQIWRALGTNPVPIAFSELYTALQTGVVDAGENPPANIIRLKFYEVADNLVKTQHSLTTMAMMCNEPWWQGLPQEARDIIGESVEEVVPSRRQSAWDEEAAALDELEKLGMSIHEIEDRAEFEASLQPLYAEFGERNGATDLINRIRETK
jgi:tripartite ATP-independent transporter DctP family solute receptor